MVNKEIAVFKCVNHPNIIKLFEITEDENNLHLIMEHADKGDLLTFIKNNGTLSEATALNFLKQLAEAVEYLHLEKSIAHRDIKLANILITSKNNNIKLADFGLSNFYDKEKMQLRTCCGSPCYSAPEILIGCQYNPIVADIWSLGVVLYSMIEGCLPFYDENVK
jgi:serine/threonine protein kinase